MNNLTQSQMNEIYGGWSPNHYSKAVNHFRGYPNLDKSPEWLANHCTHLTGSRIGAIAGASKYADSLDVFQEMLCMVEPWEGNNKTRRGAALEAEIAREACALMWTSPLEGCDLNDVEKPYISAQIDATAVTEQYGPINIECKRIERPARGVWGNGSEFDERGHIVIEDYKIPFDYKCQVYWGLGIANRLFKDKAPKTAILSALIGLEEEPRLYVIHHNEDIFNHLVSVGEDFLFNHLIPEIEPEPKKLGSLAEKYAHVETIEGDYITDTEEDKALTLATKYAEIDKQIKELTVIKDGYQLQLKAMIAEHEGIKDRNGNLVATYKANKTTKFDSKALLSKYPSIYEEYNTIVKHELDVKRLEAEKPDIYKELSYKERRFSNKVKL